MAICVYPPPCPEADFSKDFVICAFMGRRPTSGYSIAIERIWTDEERMHVQIVKISPPENFTVAQVLMSPYVFVSSEKVDMKVVSDVANGSRVIAEPILPELFSGGCLTIAFIALSGAVIGLRRRTQSSAHGASGHFTRLLDCAVNTMWC
jgi:hypothetical protein